MEVTEDAKPIKPLTEEEVVEQTSKKPKTPKVYKPYKPVPPKMIDIHCQTCEECEERRLFMKRLFELNMDPDQHTNEIMARDEMLDEMFEECCKCFKREHGL